MVDPPVHNRAVSALVIQVKAKVVHEGHRKVPVVRGGIKSGTRVVSQILQDKSESVPQSCWFQSIV